MPKYTYKILPKLVEDVYRENTGKEVHEILGNVDFSKATLTVIADSPEESEAIRKGVTDIRMWVVESVES